MSKNNHVFNDPTYSKLIAIHKTAEIPDFVANAPSIDEQDFSQVPSELFGDPANRQYPLNTASNTWLSREYLEQNKDNLDPKRYEAIKKRIDEAAKFWNLPDPVKKEHTSKKAPVNVEVKHDKETIVKAAAETSEDYVSLADYLYKNKANYPLAMRKEFAEQLLTQAPVEWVEQLPPQLSYYLHKAAGLGLATPDMAKCAISKRILLLQKYGDSEPAMKLIKIAYELPSDTEFLPEFILSKIANMLDFVDRLYDFHKMYDKFLPAPEDELHAFTEKVAECADEFIELPIGMISKSDISSKKDLIDEFFETHMGDIPYNDDSEMIIVIQSLPKPDLDALLEFIGLKDND